MGDIGTGKDNNFNKMIDLHCYHFSSNIEKGTLFSWTLRIFPNCAQYDSKFKNKGQINIQGCIMNLDYAKELTELTGNETEPC